MLPKVFLLLALAYQTINDYAYFFDCLFVPLVVAPFKTQLDASVESYDNCISWLHFALPDKYDFTFVLTARTRAKKREV
jgi:hypothetical protein